jgi:hypothetical protein
MLEIWVNYFHDMITVFIIISIIVEGDTSGYFKDRLMFLYEVLKAGDLVLLDDVSIAKLFWRCYRGRGGWAVSG